MTDDRPPDRAGKTSAQRPSVIGPYHVVEKIGEGGMGVVYSAEQLHPVRRSVAIKMLRPGHDSKEIVARFEAERHALAVMDHPGIARVIDAGVTAEDRPYFVMELVKGVRIDHYCDRFRLTGKERIALFISLCDAVQHAHQKGVIHRDLKPANVLVTERDGKPIPKVIDFGIAKVSALSLTADPAMTALGQAVGTLAYMSPEQAEGSELDVDTRTDVYSLGIILYELLSGSVPINPYESGVPQFLAQLVTRDTSVPLPHEQLARDEQTAARVARARGTDPTHLRRALASDIQWIVMRAIEKDRNRRYETVTELRLDLTRYLNDEPVLARPPSATYRLTKFARRNRGAVAAGVTAVIVLVAGSGATAVGLLRARAAEASALDARTAAELEAESAQQVVDFLVNIFEVSEPGEARGSSVTAREILDRGARRVEDELAGQPVVQARMLATIGAVHRKLGLLDDATILLSRSLALLEAGLGEDHQDVAEALYELGVTQRQRGDLEQAEANLSRAVAIREANAGPDSDEVGHALAALGGLQLVRGRLDEAEALLQRALEIEGDNAGSDHREMATIVSDLGALSLYRQEFLAAEQYFSRATQIRERQLGRRHPDVASALNNLGAAYWYQDRLEEALDAYRRAQAIWEATLDAQHPRIATIRNNVAEVYWKLGRYAEAEELFAEALLLKERTLTPNSPEIVTTLVGLANVYRDQGRYAEAELRYLRAVQIYEEALGPEHARLREPLEAYELMLRAAGRGAEADRVGIRARTLAGTS